MRPQIACGPRAPWVWSSSEQAARVRKKSLAAEAKGAANSSSVRHRCKAQRQKGQAPTNPQRPPASGAGLLAAASAFLVTRIALGIVGIGFFGRIRMLLTAGFFFGLVLGLTWIHWFAHGSLLLDAQSQRSAGCRRGDQRPHALEMANCIADPDAHDRLHFFGLQAGLVVNGSLGPSRQACQVTASRR